MAYGPAAEPPTRNTNEAHLVLFSPFTIFFRVLSPEWVTVLVDSSSLLVLKLNGQRNWLLNSRSVWSCPPNSGESDEGSPRNPGSLHFPHQRRRGIMDGREEGRKKYVSSTTAPIIIDLPG